MLPVSPSTGQTAEMGHRRYDEERDLPAVTRMWREVGWIDGSDAQATALRRFFDVGDAVVATIGGEAESAVHRTTGAFRHRDTDLPLCAVSAVTTSHVARRQSMATELVAEALAGGVDDGAAVAALGAFEQGYYERFGFGTGAYDHSLTFDPATLTVAVSDRPPVRVTAADADDVHGLLRRRHRGHGSVVLDPPEVVHAELGWIEKPFGLGYRAADGRLTHCLLGSMGGERGPYRVDWVAYEHPHQLLELLGLLRGLGDQVASVTLSSEPAEIQLQDLIRGPIRQRIASRLAGGGVIAHRAVAWWQLRILDLPRCIEALGWPGVPVSFDLRLTDPLADRGGRWPGLSGEWAVTIGAESSATRGAADDGRAVLETSVNALSRAWAGVRPPSSLALTDDLRGPAELLERLDDVLRTPRPVLGWHL